MCGIFGGIGRVDPKVIRGLAVANESRGKDSLGFFCADQSIWKKAGVPTKLLMDKGFLEYEQRFRKQWFVCGHTRHGTRGAATDQNAHPFQYGPYIGIHNGIIYQAPAKYDVDSMYLWDLLEQEKGDYHKAWSETSGWWGLAWTDGKHLMLQCHKQLVAIARTDRATYFSSDGNHLSAVLGCKSEDLSEGETLRFAPDGSFKQLKPIKVKEYKNTYSSHYGAAKIGDIKDGYEFIGGPDNEWVCQTTKEKKYGMYNPYFDKPSQVYTSTTYTNGGTQKKETGKSRQEELTSLGALSGRDVLRMDDLSSTPYDNLKPSEVAELMDLEDRFWIFHSSIDRYKSRKDLTKEAIAAIDTYYNIKTGSQVKLKHEEVHDQVSKKREGIDKDKQLVPITHDQELWSEVV